MSETAIRFTVPMVPPNLNHYVRHTRTGSYRGERRYGIATP